MPRKLRLEYEGAILGNRRAKGRTTGEGRIKKAAMERRGSGTTAQGRQREGKNSIAIGAGEYYDAEMDC